jgi:hypothetical protein
MHYPINKPFGVLQKVVFKRLGLFIEALRFSQNCSDLLDLLVGMDPKEFMVSLELRVLHVRFDLDIR